MMKTIIAFVQPFMAEKVVQALHQVPGLSGATFSHVRGFGRGRAKGSDFEMEEELLGTLPKVRIEIMIPDMLEDQILKIIQKVAHTGKRGDGKIYVASIGRALRISTGEEGENAV